MAEVKSFPAGGAAGARLSGDRPLPQNPRAEIAIAASVLQDPAACAKAVEVLRREHFADAQVGWIFFAATRLHAKAMPVDRVTVEAWLHDQGALEAAGGEARIRAIGEEFPETANLEAHAKIVVDLWERRELALLARRADALVCGAVESWEDAKARLRKDFGKVTAPRSKREGKPIGAAAEEARAQLEEAHLGKVTGTRYPWGRVEALFGLMVPGEQVIVAGPSENGKTPFATQVAVEVANTPVDALGFGEAVYFVTGEMPRDKLLQRLACSFARVDVNRARLGTLKPHEQQAVSGWLGWLGKLAIEVDPDPAPSSVIARRVRELKDAFAKGEVRTHAGEALGRRRLRLVVGDHVQEFERFHDGRDKFTRIGAAAKGWRDDIAKGCGVATMLLSQTRAPNEQERKASPGFPPWPTLDMLFGSPNELKSSADTVIGVQQPARFMSGKAHGRWRDVAGVCALKRRFGGEAQRVCLRFEKGLLHDDLAQHDLDYFEAEG